MINLTPEMIEKAKTAKTVEELLAIAKENGVEMTADEAKIYFEQLNPKSGELDDDDLDNVAGGACTALEDPIIEERVRVTSGQTCPKCGGNVGSLREGAVQWGKYIFCDSCQRVITYTSGCTYEVIG